MRFCLLVAAAGGSCTASIRELELRWCPWWAELPARRLRHPHPHGPRVGSQDHTGVGRRRAGAWLLRPRRPRADELARPGARPRRGSARARALRRGGREPVPQERRHRRCVQLQRWHRAAPCLRCLRGAGTGHFALRSQRRRPEGPEPLGLRTTAEHSRATGGLRVPLALHCRSWGWRWRSGHRAPGPRTHVLACRVSAMAGQETLQHAAVAAGVAAPHSATRGLGQRLAQDALVCTGWLRPCTRRAAGLVSDVPDELADRLKMAIIAGGHDVVLRRQLDHRAHGRAKVVDPRLHTHYGALERGLVESLPKLLLHKSCPRRCVAC
mmetsp:Transcript_33659/g.106928  ORF Transcript_33659/g.106928 Transcript_33659/m.106928 type:complete len:325 (+) Transcript_33659:176-1150(+)